MKTNEEPHVLHNILKGINCANLKGNATQNKLDKV